VTGFASGPSFAQGNRLRAGVSIVGVATGWGGVLVFGRTHCYRGRDACLSVFVRFSRSEPLFGRSDVYERRMA
jgi:hypothetical protein